MRATGSTLGERKHSERGNLLDPRSIIRVTNYHPPTHVGTIPASWKSMDGDTCPVPLVKFIDEISDSSSFRFSLEFFLRGELSKLLEFNFKNQRFQEVVGNFN